MKRALLLSLSVLLALGLSPSAAALETISSATSRMVTVASNSHDAYEVAIPSGRATADIEFSTGTGPDVDFYVFTGANYAEYADPNSSVFHYQDQQENTKSFSYSTTQSGLIFVVDNDYVSTSGASPTGPVNYVITVLFAATPPPSTEGTTFFYLLLAGVIGAAVFSISAIAITRSRRRRASVSQDLQPVQSAVGISTPLQAPVVFPQSYPPPPPQSYPPPPPPQELPPSPSTQPASMLAVFPRAAQAAQIPGQAEKLKRSTLIISVITMGMAIAYAVVQDIITMSVALVLMFATFGQVSKLRKMRKIAIGK